MNTFESILWVTLGFVPTLVAMEVAWKLAKKKRSREKLVEKVNIQQ